MALTEKGKRGALEVLRHHRLLERYLADRLGFSIDEVHAEADRLEHALSEELEAKIDAELGYPTHDPHGGPIPDRKLRVRYGRERSLADLDVGDRASISQVPDGDAALLRYLTELGLIPGAEVAIVAVAPFGGPGAVAPSAGSTRSHASSHTASARRCEPPRAVADPRSGCRAALGTRWGSVRAKVGGRRRAETARRQETMR